MNIRALRLHHGSIQLETVAAPALGADEVMLAPELVGLSWFDATLFSGGAICAFDGLHRLTSDEAFTPGHESVGRVISAGAGAGALIGQRVVVSPDLVCGVCDLCRSGLSAHCRARTLLGAPGAPGCLQERLVLPARNIVPVAETLALDHAVFALPLAHALHAASIVHLKSRPFITVLGRGAEALLAAQVMARLNATVRIVSPCAATLDASDRLGIRHRPLEHVGRRADQDVILDVSPPGAGLDEAMRMARPRGKIVLLRPLAPPGYIHDDSVNPVPVVENELELIGCRGARLREAVSMLERGEVVVDGLITWRSRLERAESAFTAAADSAHLKVVIELRGAAASG